MAAQGEESAPGTAGNTDTFEIARASIARITVMAGTQIVSRGTGTLITPTLVLSALHVVANRRAEPPQPYPGEMTLEFPGFKTQGKIVEDAWDPKADWVLIECADAPPITPMPMAAMTENKRDWESYGFPEANWRDGLLLTGTVTRCDGELEGVRAHQLECTQAAAGRGLKVKGLSGAPVVVGGMLVGVMRFALMEEERTEGGILYACPVSAVKERWPMLDVPPLPKKRVPQRLTAQIRAATAARAGWELGALAGALVVIAAAVFVLSRTRVQSTPIDADVTAADVQFSLTATDKLSLYSKNMLGVTSLNVSGLESVTVPDPRGGTMSPPVPSLHIAVDTGRGGGGQLAIDLSQPLLAGTRILLHHSGGVRYRLAIDSLAAPLGLQYSGTVRLSPDGDDLVLHSDAADFIMLRGVGRAGLVIEFDLEPNSAVKLAAPIKVRNLSYFEKFPGENNKWVFKPTITSGTLRLDSPRGDVVTLHEGDSLVAIPDTVTVSQLAFPADGGGFRVQFAGPVTRLTAVYGGITRDLMPTWLERLKNVYALVSAVAAAALVALMAYLMVRWRRRMA